METKTNNDNEQKLQQLDENELDQVTGGGHNSPPSLPPIPNPTITPNFRE